MEKYFMDRGSRGKPVYQLNSSTIFLRFIMKWNVEMCSCLFYMHYASLPLEPLSMKYISISPIDEKLI